MIGCEKKQDRCSTLRVRLRFGAKFHCTPAALCPHGSEGSAANTPPVPCSSQRFWAHAKHEPREHTMQHKMQHTVHCNLIGFSMSFSDLPHVVERGHILFRRIMLIRMRVMQATSTLWLYSAMRNGKCIFVNAFQSCKGCLDTTTNHKRSVHSPNWGRVMKSLWFSAVHHGAQLRAGIRSPRALGLFFNWSLFDFNSSLLPIDQCRQKDKDLSNGRRQWG